MRRLLAIGLLAFLPHGAAGDWTPEFSPGSYPYKFGPSPLVPRWSEVEIGQWTFNYEGALEKAKAEGRYTLLLFAGFWWCPYCQVLEEHALLKDEFVQYVEKDGYYLAALDFPYRDGHTMWTWLWDPQYRSDNGIGDWTPEQIAEEYIKRFKFQDLMHGPNPATTVNNNVLVQISPGQTNLAVYAKTPTTTYRRVAYPTIVVIAPDGHEAGRFSYDFNQADPEHTLEYVIDNIEVIKASGKNDLFDDPGAGGVAGNAAQQYDAILTDASGRVVGSATFKTAKRNKKTDRVKVTGAMKVMGSKTVSLHGSVYGAEGEVVRLSRAGAQAVARVSFGAEGVTGLYSDGAANYLVQGARNVFKAKDVAAKKHAGTLRRGLWLVSFDVEDNGGSAFANGYSGFSISVENRGKVKIKGVLGDGNKASLSSLALIGDAGKVIVPVMAKKEEYSFRLVFSNGSLQTVDGVSRWVASGRPASFTAQWSTAPVFAAQPGFGAVPAAMKLRIDGFDVGAKVAGKPVVVSPAGDKLVVKGKNWTGTKGVSDLKVTFDDKTAIFKGSFNVYVSSGDKQKKIRATVGGVVVNGVPCGTAILKNVGSWRIKFGP